MRQRSASTSDDTPRPAAFSRYALLDTLAEEPFDRLARIAVRLFDVKEAGIKLVASNRQWTRAWQGEQWKELQRTCSFSVQTLSSGEVLVVEDVRKEAHSADAFQEDASGIRFFAGAPLRSSEGFNIGVFCVEDDRPRHFDEAECTLLQDLADMAVEEMELHDNVAGALACASDLYRDGERGEVRLRALMEHTTEVIGILDSRMTFQYLAGPVEETVGFAPAELIGRSSLPYVHPEDLPAVQNRFSDSLFRAGQTREVTFRFQHKEKGWCYLSMSVRDLFDEPGVGGFLCNVRDVTQTKQFEAELIEAKEQAEEMSRLKSAFLRNMSHEVRTPLSSIIGFAEVLVDEVEGEKKDFAQLIYKGGKRLAITLRSVLDLARLEPNDITSETQPVNLAEVVQETATLFEAQAGKKELDLILDLPDGSLTAQAEETKLRQVMANLLSNAIKFTEQGWVIVRAYSEEGWARLEVQDTGRGIGEHFKPDIFGEFKQEVAGLDRRPEGAGLGLAISQRLVELMDGKITVQSEKHRGSLFTVSLPLAAPDSEEEGSQPFPSSG